MPPCSHSWTHCGVRQSSPVHPGKHVQVSGAVHRCRAGQSELHTANVQSSPSQPSGQLSKTNNQCE